MTWDLRSFMPNRISGQIALIIIASLAVIHGVLTATFFLVRPDQRPERPPDQVAVLVELIDASSASERGSNDGSSAWIRSAIGGWVANSRAVSFVSFHQAEVSPAANRRCATSSACGASTADPEA